MHRTRIGSILAVAALAAAALTAMPGAQADLPDLLNLEHVYNFPFTNPSPETSDLATDVEFYTSTVPVRDEGGAIVLDGEGDPVLHTLDLAVVGSYMRGAFVFDITDPTDPRFVRLVECAQFQNDPQVKLIAGRWILALAQDLGTRPCLRPNQGYKHYGAVSGGVALFDITDPWDYKPLYAMGFLGGAHNFTWHPTKPFGYVSTGDLPGGRNHLPVVDFSDLETADPTDRPVQVADLTSVGGPHDISFNAEGTRMYVASENNVRIYDTADPAAPVQISVTTSNGTYAHTVDVTPDNRTMVVTQESLALGGFFQPGTAVCPGEGLYFYDVTGPLENAPVPKGHFLANVHGPVGAEDARACTAHQSKIAANSRVMVVGWYAAGVRVVDFGGPVPVEVGHAVMPGTEVWSARTFKGPYIYTGDTERGFDVFRWTGAGPAPWEAP